MSLKARKTQTHKDHNICPWTMDYAWHGQHKDVGNVRMSQSSLAVELNRSLAYLILNQRMNSSTQVMLAKRIGLDVQKWNPTSLEKKLQP